MSWRQTCSTMRCGGLRKCASGLVSVREAKIGWCGRAASRLPTSLLEGLEGLEVGLRQGHESLRMRIIIPRRFMHVSRCKVVSNFQLLAPIIATACPQIAPATGVVGPRPCADRKVFVAATMFAA